MVNEFCGFKHGVIGTDKMPADTTLNNIKKADLIKLLHTAQHNYETLMWFYNNAVKVNMAQLNNNGWIPCSERLPENDSFCLVTVEYPNNKVKVTYGWFDRVGVCWYVGMHEMRTTNVHAWQPLPPKYEPKGE